jgi:hypothetical protein
MIDNKDMGTIDGFDVMARIEPDYDITPDDFDCYDQQTIDAWKADRWNYVGIVVTASRDGIELGSSSLWGCEYGDMPGIDEWVSPLNQIDDYEDVVNDAIEQAKQTLAKLVAGATDMASV